MRQGGVRSIPEVGCIYKRSTNKPAEWDASGTFRLLIRAHAVLPLRLGMCAVSVCVRCSACDGGVVELEAVEVGKLQGSARRAREGERVVTRQRVLAGVTVQCSCVPSAKQRKGRLRKGSAGAQPGWRSASCWAPPHHNTQLGAVNCNH